MPLPAPSTALRTRAFFGVLRHSPKRRYALFSRCFSALHAGCRVYRSATRLVHRSSGALPQWAHMRPGTILLKHFTKSLKHARASPLKDLLSSDTPFTSCPSTPLTPTTRVVQTRKKAVFITRACPVRIAACATASAGTCPCPNGGDDAPRGVAPPYRT